MRFLSLSFSTMLTLFTVVGCQPYELTETSSATRPNRPASGLTLSSDQRRQLGIQLSPVKSAKSVTSITRVGWFIAPPATEIILRAPVAGFVVADSKGNWPRIGEAVSADRQVAQMNVFLSPQEVSQLVMVKEENDIQMHQALVTMELSEKQLELATHAKDSVTGVRIDQIKEAYERSKVAYKEAQDKLPYLIQEPYNNGVLVKPVPIVSASNGRVLQLHVGQGQFVQAGDPLWTVSDWQTLWLRVPVFPAELSKVLTDRPVQFDVSTPSDETSAIPLNIPNAVQPNTRTLDLLYSVSNPDWRFRVGQSVIVQLPTSEETLWLVIPQSAVLYDGFGQPFCYSSKHNSDVFQRGRIELGSSQDGTVQILRGLQADHLVVSVGAEQLVAEETKSELATEDDD